MYPCLERHCHRLAMEISAAQQLAGVGEDEGIVRGGVELTTDDAGAEIDGVEHGAMYLRHAAQGVRVLYARIVLTSRASVTGRENRDVGAGRS